MKTIVDNIDNWDSIHIMVHCPYIGCPRSIGYCFKCDHKKGIVNYDLICDYRDAMKKLKEIKKLEKKNKDENLNEESNKI